MRGCWWSQKRRPHVSCVPIPKFHWSPVGWFFSIGFHSKIALSQGQNPATPVPTQLLKMSKQLEHMVPAFVAQGRNEKWRGFFRRVPFAWQAASTIPTSHGGSPLGASSSTVPSFEGLAVVTISVGRASGAICRWLFMSDKIVHPHTYIAFLFASCGSHMSSSALGSQQVSSRSKGHTHKHMSQNFTRMRNTKP